MESMERLMERQAENGFAVLTGICVEAAEGDTVVCRLDLRPEVANHLGYFHAGALYTLAENAAGTAAFHVDGRRYVTQTGSIQYISNRSQGAVRATAHILHHGRSTCMVRTELTAEDGTLLCIGEFALFCAGA